MIPSNRQLDLKKLASAVGQKKVQMGTQREAEQLTGLQVGGISPLALLNRGFDILLDDAALDQSRICISAGERGLQIRLALNDLIKATGARVADLAAEPGPA
jgi:Cys-tRNA(Pro)/Cys-tRNA(Cys) deacylase